MHSAGKATSCRRARRSGNTAQSPIRLARGVNAERNGDKSKRVRPADRRKHRCPATPSGSNLVRREAAQTRTTPAPAAWSCQTQARPTKFAASAAPKQGPPRGPFSGASQPFSNCRHQKAGPDSGPKTGPASTTESGDGPTAPLSGEPESFATPRPRSREPPRKQQLPARTESFIAR